eukprot:4158147-Pleurochrysis_carterae.AAC.4
MKTSVSGGQRFLPFKMRATCVRPDSASSAIRLLQLAAKTCPFLHLPSKSSSVRPTQLYRELYGRSDRATTKPAGRRLEEEMHGQLLVPAAEDGHSELLGIFHVLNATKSELHQTASRTDLSIAETKRLESRLVALTVPRDGSACWREAYHVLPPLLGQVIQAAHDQLKA